MQSPTYFQGLTLRDLEQLKRSMYLGTAFVEESEMKNFISVSKTFLWLHTAAMRLHLIYEKKRNRCKLFVFSQKMRDSCSERRNKVYCFVVVIFQNKEKEKS